MTQREPLTSRSDYFLPPTCPDCHATLDSDGNHWASGRPECSVVPARDRWLLRLESEREELPL